ncbi:CRISPR-associated RAMP Cmr2 [Bathymodiolus thermophilus thioautotrophic gill symbiont]|uniref:type III-B CRISPR-associated protein Cas10/Cmr2 n=1 Tax=Bathymodiolus thermophilus thioautotrophic gill symbiont TaxID=2360 RepID=UPI00192A979B|nr:type III-B CRISPR-associated protein Cas10/Cmr2 [Bathymodiolus thermophilus thioautotrophic gill symbiont]CAB5504088.1 CRISPR-associated RAMP Cmr2 [Bathymodiolus thermophilus thioautotrophic gill symbiont]
MGNNPKIQTLHFSLGPVQGFIIQARRTRDLWAGSFLLSWLSAQAMAEVGKEAMIFPKIENDPIYKAICNEGGNPYIATLPNRFQATVGSDFDVERLKNKINNEWKKLADTVFKKFIKPNLTYGNETEAIWNRQIDNFWEVQWVVVEQGKENALDKRKNWRSQCLTVEGGEHCTTMGDYQELSGQKKGEQDNFWQKVRENTSNIDNKNGTNAGADYLNLRPNERLCAIAFVKRFFVRLSKEKLRATIGWVPGYDKDKDQSNEDEYYRPLANFPSTTYMAAIPWLESIKRINEEKLKDYHDDVEKIVLKSNLNKLSGERPTELNCITTKGENNKWSNLDGNLFNQTALMNWRATKLSDDEAYYDKKTIKDPDEVNRADILSKLKKIGGNNLSASSNFYALLLMDGDNLGKLLSNSPEQAKTVSNCLADFSQRVDDIVKEHCGVTIYAGGDDVLALVPIHRVICCAQALNNTYQALFRNPDISVTISAATISAAIIFSHFHNPLTEVMDQARHQLDDIAKDKNDRNSIAMAIMKPGNLSAQWVNEWDVDLLTTFDSVANALRSNELPQGFFYKISGRYQHILEQNNDKEFFKAVVTAELVKSKGSKENIGLVDDIYKLCQGNNINKNMLQLSALYFARFLAVEDKSKEES